MPFSEPMLIRQTGTKENSDLTIRLRMNYRSGHRQRGRERDTNARLALKEWDILLSLRYRLWLCTICLQTYVCISQHPVHMYVYASNWRLIIVRDTILLRSLNSSSHTSKSSSWHRCAQHEEKTIRGDWMEPRERERSEEQCMKIHWNHSENNFSEEDERKGKRKKFLFLLSHNYCQCCFCWTG